MATITRAALASRTDRLFGQVIDGIVGGLPVGIAALLLPFLPAIGAGLVLVCLAWSAFYYLFADGFHDGQSLGKQWVGMRAVDAETGAPCTFWQSFVRNLLLALLGPIDWVFIFGERHQRLGDKAAGTIVIANED